jgi:hypothetical protein
MVDVPRVAAYRSSVEDVLAVTSSRPAVFEAADKRRKLFHSSQLRPGHARHHPA